MASVIPPDLELFLTGWLRSNITDIPGLQVGIDTVSRTITTAPIRSWSCVMTAARNPPTV